MFFSEEKQNNLLLGAVNLEAAGTIKGQKKGFYRESLYSHLYLFDAWLAGGTVKEEIEEESRSKLFKHDVLAWLWILVLLL